MRTASIAFQTKLCEAFARCDGLAFARSYQSTAACIGADKPFAELAALYAFGSVLTPEGLSTCTSALDLSTCEAYGRYRYEAILPDACKALQYGTLPEGAPCGSWNQCASGRCYSAGGALDGSCGRCVPQRAIGAQCQYDQGCVPGAVCRGSGTKTCRAFAGRGFACDAATPCHPHLSCSEGTCVVPMDDSCIPPSGCEALPTLRACNATTKKCEPAPVARDGEPCGQLTPQTLRLCAFGETCKRQPAADASTSGSTFVCAPLIEEGAGCDASEHPYDLPCRKGVCFQNLCQVNGPAQCSGSATPP